MNYKLIMLPQPILVSDETIKENEWRYNFYPKEGNPNIDKSLVEQQGFIASKIIAGIPELPSINFLALSEEDCKKIGWINEDRIILAAQQYALDKCQDNISALTKVKNAWEEGFKTAQSINDKKFTEVFDWLEKNDLLSDERTLIENEYIKSLSQLKVFDIEVEMEEVEYGHVDDYSKPHGFRVQPKITNNSIKIIKVL